MAVPAPAKEIKFARINATSDGDNTVVSAVAGKRIRVIGYMISNTGSAAGDVTFQDSASSPTVFGVCSLTNDVGTFSYTGGINCPAFETDKGVALEINCATNVDAVGHLTYQLI